MAEDRHGEPEKYDAQTSPARGSVECSTVPHPTPEIR